ncbi:MAG: hypothetical protein V7739_07690 [Motiliproteus sp.]
MKYAFPLIILLTLFGQLVAAGQSTQIYQYIEPRQQQFDTLFRALRYAPDQPRAVKVEREIWMLWLQSGDRAIDDLMQQAIQARRWTEFERALMLFNQVITLQPDYSEVWNQRAIVHFYRGDFHQSLVDISKTLELEPRHFGAMAGRGIIRLQQGKSALAVQNIKAAMQYHPYLQERYLFPFLLDEPEILAP